MTTEEFLNIFNEDYPYERYIFKNPKPISIAFNKLLLTEIWIPYTKIEPVLYDLNGKKAISYWTKIPDSDVNVKCSTESGEIILFNYYDFCDGVQENIISNWLEEIGDAYQQMYIDYEDKSDRDSMFEEQRLLNIKHYGDARVKQTNK